MSGFFGGGIDNLIQRITEIMLSIPGILLALALMATDVGSGGIDTVVIALSIIFIPRTVRVMRGSVLSCKENVKRCQCYSGKSKGKKEDRQIPATKQRSGGQDKN